MPWGTLWKAGFKGWFIGVGASVVVYFAASLLGAMPDDVYVYPEAEQPFTIAAIIVTTTLVTLVAVPVFRLLVSFSQDPVFYFRIVAAVVFIFMVPLPFSIAGAPTTMKTAILLMHLVVALGIVTSLERGYKGFNEGSRKAESRG